MATRTGIVFNLRHASVKRWDTCIFNTLQWVKSRAGCKRRFYWKMEIDNTVDVEYW